jgi:hypothetical protein
LLKKPEASNYDNTGGAGWQTYKRQDKNVTTPEACATLMSSQCSSKYFSHEAPKFNKTSRCMCCTAEPKAYTKDFRSLNLWSTYSFSVAKTSQTVGETRKENADVVNKAELCKKTTCGVVPLDGDIVMIINR